MKKRNGWLYAFWILIIVVLILALAVGLIAWAGSGNKDEGGVQPADPSEGDATVESVALGDLDVAYGGEGTLTATVTMSDGSDYEGDYAWSSDDPEIAAVSDETTSENFVTVTGVKCGTATIKVSVGEGTDAETATCTVTVSEDHETAETGRVSAVADGDERLTVGEGLAFSATSITATYESETKTYTIGGVSETMGEELATAVYDASHADCQYITFEVAANAGETINIATYNGTTPEKSWTMHGTAQDGDADGTFVVDLTDHTPGDWSMEIEVAYAGGDVIKYTIVLGDIERGVADPTDLQAAINEGGDVALTEDIELTSSLTIGSDAGDDEVEVTLDLNGNTLSSDNTTIGKEHSTIIVKANAELTVIGDGEVDASADNTAALYNEGTVILAGGTFERSKEEGTEEYGQASVNSYYTVENHGDMTIEDGAVIFNAGNYSTCLKSSGTDEENTATLTINGGKIYGGKYAVKNDYSGKLVMTGGQLGGLRSETDALPYRALDNYDEATITGGTLLGGNGGAVSSNLGATDGLVSEGLVIYNNSDVDSHTDQNYGIERGDERGVLTIGDENGNGPEIIYEGINSKAAIEETKISYYGDGETTTPFATGVAIDSGTVNFKAGTIKCADEDEDRDYNFMGVYLTNGALNVSGGSISGDEAILIDCTAEESPAIAISITGGELVGNIVVYTTEDGEVVSSVYTPGRVTAVADASDTRLAGFSPTDITAWYDPSTNTYTIDGASEAFDDDLLNWFWGSDEAVNHESCEYITFEISVAAGETLKITTVDGDEETTKVFAMYGEGVTEKLYKEDNTTELDEADGVWIIDVGDHNYTGAFKMTIEVIGADGTVSETYYVVIGTIASSATIEP